MSKHTLTIIALSLMVLISGCGLRWNKAAPAAPPAPPPVSVTVAKVVSRDIDIYTEQIGKCSSPETVLVKPLAFGRIVKVHFKEGEDVKPGAELFTIDQTPYIAAMNQAKAEGEMNGSMLLQAEATLNQYRAQLEETKTELAQARVKQN
jgi:multidrug efflux pump subunit AcrA (membrane-fusion protein)